LIITPGSKIMLAGGGGLELSVLDTFMANYTLVGMKAVNTSGNPIALDYTVIDPKSGLWKIIPSTSAKQEAVVDALVELKDGRILHLPVKDMGGVNQNLSTAIPIGSAEELAAIQGGKEYPLAWYYIQYNDIDLSSIASWTPLGSKTFFEQFTGIYEGGNKTIRNLKVNRNNSAGLFASIGRGGVLQNINVINASVKGGSSTGGLSGECSGLIQNCHFSGNVKGQANTGGITGSLFEPGAITNASFFGFVESAQKSHSGGIAGVTDGGTISFSRNGGQIEGGENTGGITGQLESKNGSIVRSINEGHVKGTQQVGGIAGNIKAGTIDSCSNEGAIDGEENIGGIAGQVKNGKIHASRNTGNITASYISVGGIAGYFHSSEIFACYSHGSIKGADYGSGIVGYYAAGGKGSVSSCYSTALVDCNESGAIIGYNDLAPNTGLAYTPYGQYITANYWLDYGDGRTGFGGSGLPRTNENAKPFGDTYSPPFQAWPAPDVHLYWGTGDGSAPGKWWKNLGKWTGAATSKFPTLYWE
jgi:hypothetical protein